jgi:tetratricopeptide (TPR) repeat protein
MAIRTPASAPEKTVVACRGYLIPGVPFVISLGLSLSTMGDMVAWQDSGFFLSAIHELGVLYPPGFVLYLLLAKAWTLLFFFIDFTRAVHLFSALCAAGAAASLALAARDLLQSQGRLFRVAAPGTDGGPVGAAVGCMAAAGYTFWSSAITAKGYAFFFLILALLLWRMIRADHTGRSRDFTIVAALIGLAWQAHPSATNFGPALLLFLAFHARRLGLKGVLARTLLAAMCAAGPALLLPLLSARETTSAFGDPQTLPDILTYLAGRRFLARPDAFGWEPHRLASMVDYFWEEFLAVGIALAAAGALLVSRRNWRLLGWILAWILPATEIALLFIIEGQHDFWCLAAWMPLYLLIAVALHELAARASRPAAAALAALAVAWAAIANRPDLDLADYRLGETYGRIHLDILDHNAVFFVNNDHEAASILYLQIVRGFRPDVLVLEAGHLERGLSGRPSWYDARVRRRAPDIAQPDYAASRVRYGPEAGATASMIAFIEANGDRRPIYLSDPLPPRVIPANRVFVPAGPLWKLVHREGADIDPKDWDFPIRLEDLPPLLRRPRSQRTVLVDNVDRQLPMPYEEILMDLLADARLALADWHLAHGKPGLALALAESVRAVDPALRDSPRALFLSGAARYDQGEVEAAEPLLRRVTDLDAAPADRSRAFLRLGRLARARGQDEEAETCFRTGRGAFGIDPELRAELNSEMRGP